MAQPWVKIMFAMHDLHLPMIAAWSRSRHTTQWTGQWTDFVIAHTALRALEPKHCHTGPNWCRDRPLACCSESGKRAITSGPAGSVHAVWPVATDTVHLTLGLRIYGAPIMADDLKNRGAQDRRRVNIHEDYEVRYWTEKWGISKEQLAQAVKRAGVSAEAVARQLGKTP